MDHHEVEEIYQNLPLRIRVITDYKVKRDLTRMYRTCENLRRNLAIESVNSRNTLNNHKLLDLRNKFSEAVTNLDQYVTIALLSI